MRPKGSKCFCGPMDGAHGSLAEKGSIVACSHCIFNVLPVSLRLSRTRFDTRVIHSWDERPWRYHMLEVDGIITTQRPGNPLISFSILCSLQYFQRHNLMSNHLFLIKFSLDRNHYRDLEALGQAADHPLYYVAFGGWYPSQTLADTSFQRAVAAIDSVTICFHCVFKA